MNEISTAAGAVRGNPYPGRGIVVGAPASGNKVFFAYFIMGRSENSRNRVLALDDGALKTRPYDESKVKDPSLIIYNAMRRVGDKAVLTNGDQTDTVVDALTAGKSFFDALLTRTFEPDAPNYTPRISALIDLRSGGYDMIILRRKEGGECERGEYSYPLKAGFGRILHTYQGDGDPLPSFMGAPREVAVEDDLDAFASHLWNALDKGNKISLFARAVDLTTGEENTLLYNKNAR